MSLMKPTRRGLLKAAGAAAAAAIVQAPFIPPARAAGRVLRVSTYGGYFERMFAQHVHPAFTRATGIAVQSVEQPEGQQFLFQLSTANKAGKPPMDIACIADIDLMRGRAMGMWRTFDPQRIANLTQLEPRFLAADTPLDHVAAMSWYMTLVVNPEEINPLPDSWTVLWGNHPNAFGVEPGVQSVIFEIAANVYFGGNEILGTKPGIDRVIAKIAQLKPNVKLWWQDEGTMQTALINDEVAGGTYMHDTAMTMIRNGTAVKSIFPKEGAIESTNFWCQLSASPKVDEAHEFLNFCCTPEAQELIARFVGSGPVIQRSKLRLSPQELAAVAPSANCPHPATLARYQYGDYMERQFTKMVTS
jgi:putative spermidine/putrescine transport system substrate-binding protein